MSRSAARSGVDGPRTKGIFAFVVGTGQLPAVPEIRGTAPRPTTLEIVGRALSYAGIALGLGTTFFVLFVAPAGVEPRRESSLLLIAGGLIVAGSLALMFDQGDKLPPRLGIMLAVRELAGPLPTPASV